MLQQAQWIGANTGEIVPVFRKRFSAKDVKRAVLTITALGTYEAYLNGVRVGDFIFAPGWTTYPQRLQVQTYEIAPLLQQENELLITVGRGWFRGRIAHGKYDHLAEDVRLLAELRLDDTVLATDESWQWAESPIRFSDIYDGEIVDARVVPKNWQAVRIDSVPKTMLVSQVGEPIVEQERLKPVAVIRTPKGETVLDFGQEITGYVEFTVEAKSGDEIRISHAEVLDSDGNFYTANLRSAKAQLTYLCKDGAQTCKPRHSFMGFRYIRADKWPGAVKPENFTAIVVQSRLRRTGFVQTADPLVNRLYENVIWGQKDNFLDVPTDCPQRDERFGWLGDAQVFIRTAARNYDVKQFFTKWLRDLAAEQRADGAVPHVVPVVGIGGWEQDHENFCGGAAWSDAAVICPWEIYLAYGDKELLQEHLPMMRKWVEYLRTRGEEEALWTGDFTYGDWLALDGADGDLKGSTEHDFLSTAYFARDTEILAQAMEELELDSSEYRQLHGRIVAAFQKRWPTCRTQTECAVALRFGLAADPKATADGLAKLVEDNGCRLSTGFVGTPCLLHALSDNGYGELAYTLLLQQQFPSWLFSVRMGATTIWEHWDSRKEDGSFWDVSMNSFNHYAYGSVADWMYGTAAGIVMDRPGYETVRLQPLADRRLAHFEAEITTAHGVIRSRWQWEGDRVRYSFDTPVPATVHLAGQTHSVAPGHYEYCV